MWSRLFFFFVLFSVSLLALPTTGDIRIAAILIKFQNDVDNTAYFYDPSTPLTPDVCRSLLFESSRSVAAFYHENSYGQVSITGDIFGPYIVPVDAPENQNDSACTCVEEVIAVADADVQFDLYDIILIIYPRPKDEHGAFVNPCGFQGINGYQTITTEDGTFEKAMIWINGFADLHIIAHEMGHLFGFTHAHKQTCEDCYNYQENCDIHNVADPFDVMGYATAPGYRAPAHFCAFRKRSVDWLTENNVYRVRVPGVHNITMTALEKNTDGIKCLSMPIGENMDYYVEFRQNIGFDADLTPLNGLLFRSSFLSGTTKMTKIIEPVCGSDELVLRQGQFFRDNDASLQVDALNQFDDKMDVRIVYNPFNIRGSFNGWQPPGEITLQDSLDIPFTVYNDSPIDITEPIYARVKFLNNWLLSEDTFFIAASLGKGDSIQSSVTFKPIDHRYGDYSVKMFIMTPVGYEEPYISDNYFNLSGENAIRVSPKEPDLVVTRILEPIVYEPGVLTEINCDICNAGTRDSGPFSVSASMDWDVRKSYQFDNIAPGDTVNITLQHTFDCGVFRFSLNVDSLDEVVEFAEYNNLLEGVVWSDRKCEGDIVRPLWGWIWPTINVNDTMLFTLLNDELYFTSLLDTSRQVVHPHHDGHFSSEGSISNRYCVLPELISRDSTILYIYNLETGTAMAIPPEHPIQSTPVVNDNWIAWLEGRNESSGNVIFAQNMQTGEKRLIDSDAHLTPRMAITKTNLLYFRKKDNPNLWIYDLEHNNESIEIPVVVHTDLYKSKNNIVVDLDHEREPNVIWREYDARGQMLSDVFYQFSHESINRTTKIWDFNENYLLYRNRINECYLYSIKENEVRRISELFGSLSEACLCNDKIIASFFNFLWKDYIGVVDISDVWKQTTPVQEQKENTEFSFSVSPNPFNSRTTMKYLLPKTSDVDISIFNTLGQLVGQYAIGQQSSGSYTFVWDGTDGNHVPVAGGVYFGVLKIDGNYQSKIKPLKMLMLK